VGFPQRRYIVWEIVLLQHTATQCNPQARVLLSASRFHGRSSCCNTPQNTATHCNTLQQIARHCIVATYCNTLQHRDAGSPQRRYILWDIVLLQHTATHCNTLQHTATHRNILQHSATRRRGFPSAPLYFMGDRPTATHCNVLQNAATHRNTPQHAVKYCNTMQHTDAGSPQRRHISWEIVLL